MTSCTRGNSNKGSLVNILLFEKLHFEKLGYMVKFQEAVQSSNAVYSFVLQNDEVRHKEVA